MSDHQDYVEVANERAMGTVHEHVPAAHPEPGDRVTGAQALIRALELEAVEVMFGYPGGCILPAYDPLIDSSTRSDCQANFSTSMVAITGQVPTVAIGSDAFQECDTVGITRSCTKHNELVMSPDDIPMAVRQAFHIATTGRPGPTLLDVPKDVLQNEMTWTWPTDGSSVPPYFARSSSASRPLATAVRRLS